MDARHGQKGLNLVPEANWTTSQMIPYYLESSVQEWEIFPIMSKIGIWNSETYKKKYIDTKRRMSTGRSLFNIGDKGSGRSNSYSSEPKVAAIGEEVRNGICKVKSKHIERMRNSHCTTLRFDSA